MLDKVRHGNKGPSYLESFQVWGSSQGRTTRSLRSTTALLGTYCTLLVLLVYKNQPPAMCTRYLGM